MDDSLPYSGPNIESPVYTDRADSGLYDSVADQIVDMESDALANLDYPEHFVRNIEEWSSNHRYVDLNGSELRVAVVGEILGPSMGTVLRAHGNYFAREGDDFKPIDDKTKVKDCLALGIPTLATVKLYNTVLNQIIVAGQVTGANEDEDFRAGRNPIVKNWTKASKEGDDHDIMMVYMLPKYGVPASAGAPTVKRTSKRRLDEVDAETGSPKTQTSANSEPRREDIRLGAHYEPTLLPDYGGPYFNHVKSKLVQLDVRDINNDLIPPWKFYDALKPGTLVLALVSLHCFVMTDTSGKERKERKIYQMNAHSIRVLSDSDEPVEIRARPIAPNAADRATANLPGRSNTSFSSFTVPSSPAKDDMVEDVVSGAKSKGKGKRSKTTS
ncbi:hypothetical protein C8R47DRAFT_1228433 [Mycena vitilis]|nr:hypothetical protein C8R47DRAFT_1231000 [Mycena vitilis]KAJ6454912.1 hypothetical protein C8R47DRAFT_1228433 [Mycena vitilis]